MSGHLTPVRRFSGDSPNSIVDRLVHFSADGVTSAGATAVDVTAVDVTAARSRALLLTGVPGVGKTALLDAAAVAATAAGMQVLRATGVEFETGIPYSGLEQLLAALLPNPVGQNPVGPNPVSPNQVGPNPVSPNPVGPNPVGQSLIGSGLDRLSRAIRGAVAAGAGAAAAVERFAVGNAALDLLRTTADERPLLLLADDVQWLDTQSAAVLGFIARRVGPTRIGFIAAARAGSHSPLNGARLPHRLLRPLDDAAAALLVGSSFPALAGRVLQRVLAEADGNPLALVELPRALTESQRADAEPLPAVLPLTRRLTAEFAARLSTLPAPCREVLLLAALDGTGSIDVLMTAAGAEGVGHLPPPNTHG